MLSFIARRILWGVLVLVLVAIITFFLSRVVPADPAAFLAGQNASEEAVAASIAATTEGRSWAHACALHVLICRLTTSDVCVLRPPLVVSSACFGTTVDLGVLFLLCSLCLLLSCE